MVLSLSAALAVALALIALVWLQFRQPVSSLPDWQWDHPHGGFRGMVRVAVTTLALGSAVEAAAAPPMPATRIGINLTSAIWDKNERSFANLMMGGAWLRASPTKGWGVFDPQFLTPDGGLSGLPPGDGDAVRMLTRPDTGPGGATIRCTYQGRGEVTVHGEATDIAVKRGEVRFRWVNLWQGRNVWLQVHKVDPAAPLTHFDCRETTMPAEARFDPAFVNGLKGYKVLRFMDWMSTNFNEPVRWASRHTPATINIMQGDGVAVEDIVALSTAVGADAWVNMPWNADDDYIEHFARTMHDSLPPERAIYVELGNEVWNWSFSAARQASKEGLERGLATSPAQAQLLRYAQRTVEVMRIWERVFADRPARLIRVIATQHFVPRSSELVLGAPGVAQHVDALATAPYFGLDLMSAGQTTDLDEIFRRLGKLTDDTIAISVQHKAVAARFGKRYIAYEAGQHVVLPSNLPLSIQIQRDPRMYDVYKRYIHGWREYVGDTLTIFATTGQILPGGAFGLAEHSGQSPAEAPKLRAVLEERDR